MARNDEKRLIMTNLSITEAAKILGVTRQGAYVAMRNGRILATKCPNTKKWLITTKDVEAYKQSKYSRDLSRYNGELIFDKSKGLYSVQETAQMLDIPAQKIYYALRLDYLKSHRRGAAWVVHIDDIRSYGERYLTKGEKEVM